MHTRNNLESFKSDSFAIKQDIEKCKILKKLMKMNRKKVIRNHRDSPLAVLMNTTMPSMVNTGGMNIN
jgi:hypothetical protein